MRDSLLTEVAKVRETATLSTASSRQHLNELRDELETARKQAATAAGEARKDALKHADQLARQTPGGAGQAAGAGQDAS